MKHTKGEVTVNMCLAIQEIKEEGREEGKKEGREEGKKEGREEGKKEGREEGKKEGRLEGEIIGIIRANKRWNIPLDDTRQYIIEEYNKSETEADELLTLYWK